MVLSSLTSALIYPLMASGGGWTYQYYRKAVREGYIEVNVRQFYLVRYLDWVITASLMILSLTILAGLSGAEILFTLVAGVAVILIVLPFRLKTFTIGTRWSILHPANRE